MRRASQQPLGPSELQTCDRVKHAQQTITMDKWIEFEAAPRVGVLFVQLRQELDKLLYSALPRLAPTTVTVKGSELAHERRDSSLLFEDGLVIKHIWSTALERDVGNDEAAVDKRAVQPPPRGRFRHRLRQDRLQPQKQR